MVIIVAKPRVDLGKLSDPTGPMFAPCGAIGPSITLAVKEGNGKANFSLLNLKIVMDIQSEVEIFLIILNLLIQNRLSN